MRIPNKPKSKKWHKLVASIVVVKFPVIVGKLVTDIFKH